MNWKTLSLPYRIVAEIAATFVALLFLSWLAGQCRTWRTPPAPKPTPAIVDAGTPVAGPAAEAPTLQDFLSVARPDLTRAELEAYAKKYGLTLRPLRSGNAKRPHLDVSADVSPQEQTETVAKTFPMLLAEESFKHAPSNADVDVSAWLPAYGERVDLRAKWRQWTPPPTPAAKIPVCQSGSFFQNEAKWVKELGGGVIAGNQKAGLGGWGSLAYRGPKTGAVTWGARGLAAYSPQSGLVGVGGLSVSW